MTGFRSVVILLISISLLSLGLPAVASEGAPHVCFRAVDGDQDGKVTFDEFRAFFEKLGEKEYKALDTNKDGVLDHGEYHDALGHGKLGR